MGFAEFFGGVGEVLDAAGEFGDLVFGFGGCVDHLAGAVHDVGGAADDDLVVAPFGEVATPVVGFVLSEDFVDAAFDECAGVDFSGTEGCGGTAGYVDGVVSDIYIDRFDFGAPCGGVLLAEPFVLSLKTV